MLAMHLHQPQQQESKHHLHLISINSFLQHIQSLLNTAQQEYIIWMISYEFPGIGLLIDRMNSVGARVSKNELALFVWRQDVVKLAKDLEPKTMENSILNMRKRLRKHFESPDLESLQIQGFIWVLLKAKLTKISREYMKVLMRVFKLVY